MHWKILQRDSDIRRKLVRKKKNSTTTPSQRTDDDGCIVGWLFEVRVVKLSSHSKVPVCLFGGARGLIMSFMYPSLNKVFHVVDFQILWRYRSLSEDCEMNWLVLLTLWPLSGNPYCPNQSWNIIDSKL